MNHETDVVIRTAVEADRAELQRVYRAAALSNPGDAPGLLAHPEYLVFSGDGITQGRTRVAVVGKGHLAGFATLAEEGEEPGATLDDLFVDPAHRRRGIARRLVRDVADTARRAGHRRLTVIGSRDALAFYRAAGFVEAGHAATALGPAPRLRLDL